MSARVRWCGCGHRTYRSRGQARRQLDTARQACRLLGQPPETWPCGVHRCTAGNFHHHSDRAALERRLRTNWCRVLRLLERQTAA